VNWIKTAMVPSKEIDTLVDVATDLYNASVSALNELKGEYPGQHQSSDHKALTIQGLEQAIAKAEEAFHQ